MKNFFRAISFSFALGLLVGAFAILDTAPVYSQQLACTQNVQFDGSASAKIFTAPAGAGPRQMFICGYTINNGGTAGSIQFKYGTGALCVTNSTSLTPNWVLPINGQVMDDAGIWHGLTVPAGQDLCIILTTSNSAQAIVYYVYQ